MMPMLLLLLRPFDSCCSQRSCGRFKLGTAPAGARERCVSPLSPAIPLLILACADLLSCLTHFFTRFLRSILPLGASTLCSFLQRKEGEINRTPRSSRLSVTDQEIDPSSSGGRKRKASREDLFVLFSLPVVQHFST